MPEPVKYEATVVGPRITGLVNGEKPGVIITVKVLAPHLTIVGPQASFVAHSTSWD
jgi:hypothetical protein